MPPILTTPESRDCRWVVSALRITHLDIDAMEDGYIGASLYRSAMGGRLILDDGLVISLLCGPFDFD